MRWLVPTLGALILMSACAGGRDDAAVTARAKAALDPFKKALRGALETALSQGPPEAAVDVCAEAAPKLAAAAAGPGVKVGRASLRLRNPGNAAPAWLAPSLEGLDGPRVLPIDDRHVGYAEPIVLGEVCVTCHGKDVAAPVRARLAERYPADAATGYAVGDRRGAFWVELEVAR